MPTETLLLHCGHTSLWCAHKSALDFFWEMPVKMPVKVPVNADIDDTVDNMVDDISPTRTPGSKSTFCLSVYRSIYLWDLKLASQLGIARMSQECYLLCTPRDYFSLWQWIAQDWYAMMQDLSVRIRWGATNVIPCLWMMLPPTSSFHSTTLCDLTTVTWLSL